MLGIIRKIVTTLRVDMRVKENNFCDWWKLHWLARNHFVSSIYLTPSPSRPALEFSVNLAYTGQFPQKGTPPSPRNSEPSVYIPCADNWPYLKNVCFNFFFLVAFSVLKVQSLQFFIVGIHRWRRIKVSVEIRCCNPFIHSKLLTKYTVIHSKLYPHFHS